MQAFSAQEHRHAIRADGKMLDTFGMAKGGKEYRRLLAAFERIFGATILFGT